MRSAHHRRWFQVLVEKMIMPQFAQVGEPQKRKISEWKLPEKEKSSLNPQPLKTRLPDVERTMLIYVVSSFEVDHSDAQQISASSWLRV